MTIYFKMHVKSEYHIGTGLHRPGEVDNTLVIRPGGKLVIPGESLRGVVRDHCVDVLRWLSREETCCQASREKLPGQGVQEACGLHNPVGPTPCVLCRLFGTTFTPRRYHFFDLEPETSSDAGKVRRISYHNRIDASTGRVPEDVFFSYELGPTMTFTSRLERILPPALSDDEEAQRQADEQLAEEVGLLVAGLRLVERIGGKSARGFGVCQIEVGEPVQGRPVDEWLAAYVTPAGEGEQP